MNTEKIRQLNDLLRKTFGGQVMLTTGIRAKSFNCLIFSVFIDVFYSTLNQFIQVANKSS